MIAEVLRALPYWPQERRARLDQDELAVPIAEISVPPPPSVALRG